MSDATKEWPVQRSARTLEHWVLFFGSLAGVLGLLLLGLFVEPDPRGFGTHEKLGLPPCRTIEWWNVPCPGCGVTTSVTHAAHGDIAAALETQPFGLVIALGIVVAALWAIAGVARGRDLYRDLQGYPLRCFGFVVAGVMLAAWIYKIAIVRGWIG